jgi:hypothetical protein
MYMLIRSLPFRQLLLEQVPMLGTAFIIGELFYKFHWWLGVGHVRARGFTTRPIN